MASITELRRAARVPVRLQGQLRGRGIPGFDVTLVDMSTSGFRAEAVFRMNIGQTVWLKLPGLSGLEASVAWRGPLVYGFSLHQPLHPAVFEHLVATVGHC